jgi:hypothetical protein
VVRGTHGTVDKAGYTVDAGAKPAADGASGTHCLRRSRPPTDLLTDTSSRNTEEIEQLLLVEYLPTVYDSADDHHAIAALSWLARQAGETFSWWSAGRLVRHWPARVALSTAIIAPAGIALSQFVAGRQNREFDGPGDVANTTEDLSLIFKVLGDKGGRSLARCAGRFFKAAPSISSVTEDPFRLACPPMQGSPAAAE